MPERSFWEKAFLRTHAFSKRVLFIELGFFFESRSETLEISERFRNEQSSGHTNQQPPPLASKKSENYGNTKQTKQVVD